MTLPLSQQYLGQEIDNIVVAFNTIAQSLMEEGATPLTSETIATFNRLVLNNLEVEAGVIPGQVRTGPVAAGPYEAAPAEDAAYLVSRLCEWLQTLEAPESRPDLALAFAIVKAIVAHVYFEWIHPFGDGNGRTGRLIEFRIMLVSAVPFPAAHLLSNHYNQTRSEYYRQLHLASQSGGDLVPFLIYAVQGLVDGLRSTVQRVQEEQMDVMWENYVHHTLPGNTVSAERRRRLVLSLSGQTEPVRRTHLMTLTSEVTDVYADRGSKTLTRDLNVLRDLGLIRSTSQGYIAAKEQVRGFLPSQIGS